MIMATKITMAMKRVMASKDDDNNHVNDNNKNNDNNLDNNGNENNNIDDNTDAIIGTNLVGALFQLWEGGLVWQDCQWYRILVSSRTREHKVIVGVGFVLIG
jgi:hypothetical protein